MSIKIASLFVELTADNSKVKKALGETKDELGKTQKTVEKTSRDAGQLALNFAAVAGAAAGVVVATRAVYDFVRSSAEIDSASQRFDNLAKSIGTTGDALMIDLRRATGGIYDDMQLMASASDFVALGFAKTSDEAVRLATVAGALNMNMNQLVLTLANKTTMRFDQLGVAVEGFDERLQKLKDTGMDTDAAFKEAFLQQAEDQIKLVGNAADSSVGAFMRFEASIRNLGNSVKSYIGDIAAPALDAFIQKMTETANIYTFVFDVLGKQNEQSKKDAAIFSLAWKYALDETGHNLYNMSEAQKNAYLEMARLSYESYTLTDAMSETAYTVQTFAEYQAGLNTEVAKTPEMLDAERKAMEELSKANQNYLSSIDNTTKRLKDFKDREAEINEELRTARAELRGLIDEGLDPHNEKIVEAQDKIADLSQELRDNADEHEMWSRRNILNMTMQMLAVDGLTSQETNALLKLGLQWGIYSQEAVDEMADVMAQAGLMASTISNLPPGKTFTIDVITRTSGVDFVNRITNMRSDLGQTQDPQMRALGGPVDAGGVYQVNERGDPELLTVGSNQYLLMGRQAGYVTPTQSGGGAQMQMQDNSDLINAINEMAARTAIDYDRLARSMRDAVLLGAE